MFDRFIKGEVAINCETEQEAIDLFIFLKSRNIRWRADYRTFIRHYALTHTNWKDYKENTHYFYLPWHKGLVFWNTPDQRECIKFKDIPKEELIVQENNIEIDNTLKSLTNNHAIICRSELEAIELFIWLGDKNVEHSSSGGYCSKYNTGWHSNTDLCYVITDNKSTDYGHSIKELENLKYKFIEYNDFKEANNIKGVRV